jgi:hypothetical protein
MELTAELILKETEGLSKTALKEVFDFILFLKYKSKKQVASENVYADLVNLDTNEMKHLEEEFVDYKKLYPIEK